MADDFTARAEDQQQEDPSSEAWAEEMAAGEDFDESVGGVPDETIVVERELREDERGSMDGEDAPEGAEARDEEWADDDPADVPDEHGGTQAGQDTDDDGVDDTVLPEGTDSIVEADDWE